MPIEIDSTSTLPTDSTAGTLVGRVWRPDIGPSVVAIRNDGVFDISRAFATVRDLCESADPAAGVSAATGERIGDLGGDPRQHGRRLRATRRSPGCSRRSTCRR